MADSIRLIAYLMCTGLDSHCTVYMETIFGVNSILNMLLTLLTIQTKILVLNSESGDLHHMHSDLILVL